MQDIILCIKYFYYGNNIINSVQQYFAGLTFSHFKNYFQL